MSPAKKVNSWGHDEFAVPNGAKWDNGDLYLRLPTLRMSFEWCDDKHNPRLAAVQRLIKSMNT